LSYGGKKKKKYQYTLKSCKPYIGCKNVGVPTANGIHHKRTLVADGNAIDKQCKSRKVRHTELLRQQDRGIGVGCGTADLVTFFLKLHKREFNIQQS